ncbi:MAG: SH3 domain-containing protein [bacterium]|nr:SH3 domain-containing protein [bacterium]
MNRIFLKNSKFLLWNFRFWILDFGLRNLISLIENRKSKIENHFYIFVCNLVLVVGILCANFVQSAQPAYLVSEIIPNPEDENWSKGFAAFSNYDYEAAIKYLTASNEVLSKYYLARIYFGDAFVNNLERKPAPPIDRTQALTILGQYLGYSEMKGLLNDYLSLNADKKGLSEFYFEKGNYEAAIKVRESIKPSREDNLFITKCRYFQGVEQRFITPIRDTKAVLRQANILPSQQKELVEPPVQRGKPQRGKPQQGMIEEIGEFPVVNVDEKLYPEPVSRVTSTPTQEVFHPKQAVVAVQEAIVWDSPAIPNTSYKALFKIKQGTIVTILDTTSAEWYYKVCLPDGQVGWICSVLLKEVTIQPMH